MADTLPSFTRTIDNAFTDTWYDIKKEATDNILAATVVWAILKSKGCFTTQSGSELITRTIQYAVPTDQVVGVARGDTLPSGETESETMAIWKWRYMAAPIQRTLIKDQQNSGPSKIKGYVERGLKDVRNAFAQVLETSTFRAVDTSETGHKYPQSLNDILVPYASRATGTWGGIARSNTWWQNTYKAWTLPREVNLVTDMRTAFNTATANMSSPDLIITDQTIYETYEDFGVDQSQIVKNETPGGMDLGFKTLKFKGADMIYSPNITASTMMMLNTEFIEVVYDPAYWMEMTEWKAIPLQFERIAHLIATCNMISDQPRRHVLCY